MTGLVAGFPLRWKGRPVPFVTQWTGELIDPAASSLQVSPSRLTYADGQGGYIDRDSRGVLWMRYGNAPGEGEPLWAQVHVGRQRRAMRQARCQVCSVALDRERIPWLLPGQEAAIIPDEDSQVAVTVTAPCCEACWDTADRLCPYLGRTTASQRGWLHGVRRWGVLGDVYGSQGIHERLTLVGDDDARMPLTLAKQMAVTWHRFERSPRP